MEICPHPVAPAVAHGYGFGHIGAPDHNGLAVPVHFGLGQMELTVFSGKFKAHDIPGADALQIRPYIREAHFHAAIRDIFHALRARKLNAEARVHAIDILQGTLHHHIGHLLLLGRMDRHLIADGLRAHGPGQRQDFLCVQLILHKEGTPAAVGIAVVVGSQQGEDKGKVKIPLPAPHFHHGFLQFVVAVRLAHVGAALVPDDALGGIAYDGLYAAVPDELRSFRPAVRLFLDGIHLVQFLLRESGSVDGLPGHPGLDAASAPGIYDDAYGNVQRCLEALGKEIAHGRCLGRHLGAAVFPAGLHIFYRLCALRGLDIEHTDVPGRSGSRHNGLGSTLHFLEAEAAQRHLHIGLAAANPHFSQHDIAAGKGLLPRFHAKGADRSIGLAGGNDHLPAAVVLHGSLVLGSVPAYNNRLARISPSPYGNGTLLLQHGVVGENAGQDQTNCQYIVHCKSTTWFFLFIPISLKRKL